MKSYRYALSVLASVAAFGARAGVLEEAMYHGRAMSFYGALSVNSPYAKLMADAQESRVAEIMASFVGPTLVLKRDLHVGVAACGQPNAFYKSSNSSVTICVELLDQLIRLGKLDESKKNSKAVLGAILGIYFHELGHALIDIDGIPITGREEDVADQFSVYYSLKYVLPKGLDSVIPMAWYYEALAHQREVGQMDESTLRFYLSDVHSLSGQRVYSVACWAYGAYPDKAEKIVKHFKIPGNRLAGCAHEYQKMAQGVHSQFGAYLKAAS